MTSRPESEPEARLRALLAAAESASPLSRIEYRDQVAAFGPRAVAAMLPWIRRTDLGAFAVRVIEATTRFGVSAVDATLALEQSARLAANPAIRQDIDQAVSRLGASASHGTKRSRQTQGNAAIGTETTAARREARRPWSDDELAVLVAAYMLNEFAIGDDERVENHVLAAAFGRTRAAVDRQWRNVADLDQRKDVLHVGGNVAKALSAYKTDPVWGLQHARDIARSRRWPLGELLHGRG